MSGSTHSLCSHTPQLAVFEPRGLIVRSIEFHRRQQGAELDTLINRQRFDDAGHLIACQDPRLGEMGTAQENLTNLFSLAGIALASDSVDAGWRATLPGVAGESRAVWDSREQMRQNSFDEMLRLVAVSEQTVDGEAVTVERLMYGAADEDACNRCGRLIRHDDTAGTLLIDDYGMFDRPLIEQRKFLKDLKTPDWPLPVEGRQALLEDEYFKTRYSFNALGEVLSQVDARNNTRRFGYDIAGHMVLAVLHPADSIPEVLLSEISFNALNQVERETAGNGVTTHAHYCAQSGRLLSLQSGLAGEPALQRLNYAFDPVGNVVAVEDACRPTLYFRNQTVDPVNIYVYDSLYRLIEGTGYEFVRPDSWRGLMGQFAVHADSGQLANYHERYEYDSASNIQTLVHSGSHPFTLRNVTSRASNRSLQVQGDWVPGEQEIAEGFDANGNVLELFRGQSLAWDARNQLRQVTPVERDTERSDSECYVYGASGQRVRKVRLALTRRNLRAREVRYLPGLQLHFDSVGDKSWHVIEIKVGRSVMSWVRWEQGAPPGEGAGFGRFSLTDHLGSTTLELDEAGSIVSQESYYPYGGTAWWLQTGHAASFKTRRYSGKEQDASGLYDYGARYYAPWLMHWINPDPAGSIDGINLFRFVRNNPLTMTDPNGRNPTVTLLYGFDPARDKYLQSSEDVSSRSIVTIDLLNAGIGISPNTVSEYYDDVIGPFFDNGGEVEDEMDDRTVPEEGVDIFMEKASFFKGDKEQARALLQSWSDFLYANNERFNVRAKLQRESYGRGTAKLNEFWRKNLDAPLPQSLQDDATDELLGDLSEGNSEHAGKALTNWTFRRLSKLGLEWANSESAAVPGEVQFVDIGLTEPGNELSAWADLTPDQYQAPRNRPGSSGNAYEPITYSERRHIVRHKMAKVSFVRMNQLQH